MAESNRLAVTRWGVATLVALFAAYTGALLYNNYRSQVELREAAIERFHLSTQQRAANLSDYYAGARKSLQELAASQALAAYFTNRALGMSMRYGLRASLLNIGRRLNLFEQTRLHNGMPVFAHLQFLDTDGEVLAQSDGGLPESAFVPGPLPAAEGDADFRTSVGEDGAWVRMALAYEFKNQRVGWLVGWIDQHKVNRQFLTRLDGPVGRHDHLINEDGRDVSQNAGALMQEHARLLKNLPAGTLARIESQEHGHTAPHVAVSAPVTDSGFTLVSVAPETEVLPAHTPVMIMLTSGALPLVLLLAFAVHLRFRYAHDNLKLRYRHSNQQRRNLADEVVRRQEAERLLMQEKKRVEQHAEALQQAMQETHRLAFYDGLTQLANRMLFQDRFDQAIAQARRHSGMLGLLFLDLDRFKLINDTLGHPVGDELLKIVAGRLEESLRSGDAIQCPWSPRGSTVVSRQGGDEFTILLVGIHDAADVARVAQRLLHDIARPIVVGESEFCVNTSIGISLYPDDGEDSAALIKNADTAMYKAKERGGNTFRFYESSMNAYSLRRLMIERELRKALAADEIEVHYQAQIDLASGRIVGAEALVRWQHRQMGPVPPAELVSVAEETSLIMDLTHRVIHHACRQCARWEAVAGHPIRVSVNLSARHFNRHAVMEIISAALRSVNLPADRLEVEITESVLMQNREEATRVLEDLRAMGVTTAIDDFGTGYSSLSYLKSFPISTLKIDRSFIRDLASDPDDAAITRAIIALGHSLDMSLVAEGVETIEQRDFLIGLHCEMAQGFLYSRAVPAETFIELLGGWKDASVAQDTVRAPRRVGR